MGITNRLKAIAKYVKYNGKITHLSLAEVHYGGILRGKKIVVTGGGSGIGLAMAKKFLSEGAEVVITGRNIEKIKEVEASINNPNLHVLQWDVIQTGEINEKLQKSVELMDGGLDAIVNNAGFVEARKDTEEFWDSSINTNAKSVYFICKNVADLYERLNKGKISKILNISSMSSFINNANPYGISKTCINRITKGFAREYASKNIIVNAIAPGYCASSINYQDVEENAYLEKDLIHRIIMPSDIAELATFLLSDAANAIVGQVITVDGGTTL